MTEKPLPTKNTSEEVTKPVNIDGVVNPAMLHAHLTLLTKFKALEQSDALIDMRYLLRAQERYVLWLNLLGSQKFNEETMPIPPIGE
jgi:hypothetical protein